MKPGTSRKIAWTLKALVSGLFVAAVLRAVDLGALRTLFADIAWKYVAPLLAVSAVGITASCLKWRVLLRAKGYPVRLGYLMGLYVLGYFFNNFMPSMVGGDVARGHYLGKRIGSARDGYLSVFMERLTGLIALLALVATVLVAAPSLVNASRVALPLAVFVALCPPALALLLSRRLFAPALRFAPRGMRGKLDSLHESLTEFSRHPLVFAEVVLLSLLFHLTTGVNVLVACQTLNCHADPLRIMLVTPLIIVASLIPITINGIGLWEGGFVLFLALAGVPGATALSAALLLRVKNLLVSALGAAVFWAEDRGARAGLRRAAADHGGRNNGAGG